MKFNFIQALFSFLFISIISFSSQAQSSYPFTIIETQTGKTITIEDLLEKLKPADIVFLGEEHDDSVAHFFESFLFEGMSYLTRGHLSLSMEMWERDVQRIMDEYLAGYISEKNFKKESRAWNNYEDYKPLIEWAKAKNIPVICANSPARYTNMVTRGTLNALYKLPKNTRKQFLPPMPIDTLKGAYYENFLEAMGGHNIPNMFLYQSQNLWDATMAHSILENMAFDPFQKILHINGKFHSDHYLGVAYRVKQFDAPKYNVVTISCNSFSAYEPALHQSIADFVVLTR